nr:putative cupredoxin [Tanacetum cinerariifolium]
MALMNTQLLIQITIIATILAVGSSNPNVLQGPQNWNFGFNYTNEPSRHPNPFQNSRRVIVGGSDNWRFGFNYTEWARTNAPFYFNDTLVFKFDPPSDTNIHPHSIYLLPNLWSFLRCDLRWAKRVANTSQGAGQGFEFVLNKWKPYYFACGESKGFHCQSGMKFFVMPSFRWQ